MTQQKDKISEADCDVIFNADFATIGLQFFAEKLTRVIFLDENISKAPAHEAAQKVKQQIMQYLDASSGLKQINVEMQLRVTPFQQAVLQQLQRIPYGETRTYGELAKRLQTSARAVGNACRNNPLPVIIPCHRVVAADNIGGYDGARSGQLLAIKYRLLEIEGVFH